MTDDDVMMTESRVTGPSINRYTLVTPVHTLATPQKKNGDEVSGFLKNRGRNQGNRNPLPACHISEARCRQQHRSLLAPDFAGSDRSDRLCSCPNVALPVASSSTASLCTDRETQRLAVETERRHSVSQHSVPLRRRTPRKTGVARHRPRETRPAQAKPSRSPIADHAAHHHPRGDEPSAPILLFSSWRQTQRDPVVLGPRSVEVDQPGHGAPDHGSKHDPCPDQVEPPLPREAPARPLHLHRDGAVLAGGVRGIGRRDAPPDGLDRGVG